jgi:hypothetical protein
MRKVDDLGLFCFSFGLIALLAACGSGSPTSPGGGGAGDAPTAQGLPGTWRATRAEFVSAANSSVRVEIVSQGTVLTLSLEASGNYTLTVVDPGQAGTTQTGTWTATRDVLTLRPSGVSWSIQFDYTLNGSTLTLAGGHVEFDVNDDGAPDETILNATLTRQ